jgi:hypothetical protein
MLNKATVLKIYFFFLSITAICKLSIGIQNLRKTKNFFQISVKHVIQHTLNFHTPYWQ